MLNWNEYYLEKRKRFGLWNNSQIRYATKGTKAMLTPQNNEKILVSLRHVDVNYGFGTKTFRAIMDLNLNIYQGEVLGLVGESGSGKSTIGKTLVGLVPYSFGEIKLLNQVLPKKLKRGLKFGKALQEYKQIENFLVNKVQMIFQDPTNSLNPHVNIETIVEEGLNNTKNAKVIYLHSFDEKVLKNVYELIDPALKANDQRYSAMWFENLNQLVLDQLPYAYQIIYEDLLKDLQLDHQHAAVKVLQEAIQERSKLQKASESEAKKALVKEILLNVGLDETILKRYPLEFSGGQQQRIGISRSVVLRPSFLIADEPISALDVSIQAQVVNIFNDLKEKYRLTILFIAHDLRMVEYISDRIAVMNKGRLLEIGTTEEITKNSLHPYTKSLLEAVPSVSEQKASLLGYVYDENMHQYDENRQPEWIQVNKNHFLLATHDEYERWKRNIY